MTDERPYSPGLEGVVAAETGLGYVDGERGRLLYRGYRIGDLVERGTYPAVANLLWTGEWDPAHRLATGKLPEIKDLIERTEIVRDWLESAARCECPSLEACPLFDDPDLPERTRR